VLPPSRRERGGMYIYNCGKDDLYLLSAILKIKMAGKGLAMWYNSTTCFHTKVETGTTFWIGLKFFVFNIFLPEYLKEVVV
jgi:hypothetical protein